MRAVSKLLRPFLDPNVLPFLFIIGAILLNLIGNAVYEQVKVSLGTPGAAALLAVCLLIVLVLVYAIWRWLRGLGGVVISDIQPSKGLIVLVSQGAPKKIPANAAIQYHLSSLKYLWLITTRKPAPPREQQAGQPVRVEPSAYDNACALRDEYDNYEQRVHVEIREVERDDPHTVFETVNQVFAAARRYKLRPTEVVADFTGGTKPMTVGMVLACNSSNRRLEYLRPNRFTEDGRADPEAGSIPKLIDLRFSLPSAEDGAGR